MGCQGSNCRICTVLLYCLFGSNWKDIYSGLLWSFLSFFLTFPSLLVSLLGSLFVLHLLPGEDRCFLDIQAPSGEVQVAGPCQQSSEWARGREVWSVLSLIQQQFSLSLPSGNSAKPLLDFQHPGDNAIFEPASISFKIHILCHQWALGQSKNISSQPPVAHFLKPHWYVAVISCWLVEFYFGLILLKICAVVVCFNWEITPNMSV